MKKLILAIAFSLPMATFAQEDFTTIPLTKGQTIKVISKDSTFVTQVNDGETNEMTSVSKSVSTLKVHDKKGNQATLFASLTKMNINFDGYGQKMEFDSEDPAKQNGPMAGTIKDRIGKNDTLLYDQYGKLIDAPDKAEAKKGKGRGLMRMMNQGSGYTENVFLSMPKGIEVGKGWKVDNSKNDIKSQTIYFLDKVDGDIAIVSFKKKTKGEVVNEMQGMSMTTELDNLSEGELSVNTKTGIVQNFKEVTQSKSSTKVMGKDIKSTSTTVSEITFE